MRPLLRQDVIATATELFNRSGYHSVGMRDIAAALGISVGNLTYHFPKKQDILQAIMEQNFYITAMQEEIVTLRQFQTMLNKMLDSLEVNAFYFRDPTIIPLNDKGAEDVSKLYHILLAALENLRKNGLFQDSLDPRRQKDIAWFFMMSHLAWFQKTAQISPLFEISRNQFMKAHWTLLMPYLTEAGWIQYRQDIESLD